MAKAKTAASLPEYDEKQSSLPKDDSVVHEEKSMQSIPEDRNAMPANPDAVVQPSNQNAIARRDTRSTLIASLQDSEALKKSKFIVCKPNTALIEALEANGSAGEQFRYTDLPRAKVPTGGGTKWQIESVLGDEMVETINGVLVFYGKAGVLWAHEIMKKGSRPLLRTDDLLTAVQTSEDFGELDQQAIEECFVGMIKGQKAYDWQKLPYNQWGSGKGNGKRCKEQRLLCILREGDLAPIFVRVPPASVSEISSFMRKLTLLAQMPHYRMVVSLGLQKETNNEGIEYAKINIKKLDIVSEEEGKFFKAMFTDALGSAMSEAVETPEFDHEGSHENEESHVA